MRNCIISIIATVLFLSLPGCPAARRPPKPVVQNATAFTQTPLDQLIVFVFDLSSSFVHQHDISHQFMIQTIGKFCQKRKGTNDRILLTQISGDGDNDPLLWQGSPAALRRKFPNPAALHTFLHEASMGGASPIFSSTTKTLDYVLGMKDAEDTRTGILMLVLSDMDANTEPDDSKQKLLDALKRFGHRPNVALGLYWVSASTTTMWRDHLDNAGIRDNCVIPDISGEPTFPNTTWSH